MGGALAGRSTAYLYDWNMLPIGQSLWLKELETYQDVPADAGPGELQPVPGHGPAQEASARPGPVTGETSAYDDSSGRLGRAARFPSGK